MARTPKAPTARGRGGKALKASTAIAEAKAEQEKNLDTTLAMPSSNEVTNASKRIKGARKQAKEISGTGGDYMRKFCDEKNGDRPAMNMAIKLDGMSDAKLHVTYHHLMKYMDDLGITKRATAQGRLPVETQQGDNDAPEGDADGAQGGFKVLEGGRQVAEAAGAG